MTQWLTITDASALLKKNSKVKDFSYIMLRYRIRKGDLRAVNISSKDTPIWRIKAVWLKKLEKIVLREQSIPTMFKPSEKEKEEAIFYFLSMRVGKKITRNILRSYFPKLSESERKILSYRYGLDDNTFKTLSTVANQLKVSRQRIFQIEKRAIKKLNKTINGK